MVVVGLFLDTARTVLSSLRERSEEVRATALLKKALRVMNTYAEAHWHGNSVEELPGMIHELARDRDDFRKMSIAYREDLANAEARVRSLESSLKLLKEATSYHDHQAWCSVFGRCNCSELDEDP